MASVLKNPKLLLVLCMTASFSSAAPASTDQDSHGRISMRVYRPNRTYAIQRSPVQEVNPRTVPAVNNRRAAGKGPPASYARPPLPDANLRISGQTDHGSRGTVLPVGSHRASWEAPPVEYVRRPFPDSNLRRPVRTDHGTRRTILPVDSHRVATVAPPAAYPRPFLPEASDYRPGQTHTTRNSEHPRHRYPVRSRHDNSNSGRDHSTYGGSRYGVRRMVNWNRPSVDVKMDSERRINVYPPRPQMAHHHQPASQTKLDNGRRKKWIHCHQDGIAFVSEDAVPVVSGI